MISFIIPFRSENPYRVHSYWFVYCHLMKHFSVGNEIITADNEGDFSRPAARNLGALIAKGDVLVFVDADSWVNHAHIADAVGCARIDGWALPYTEYCSLNKEISPRFIAGQAHPSLVDLYDDDCDYIFPSAEHPEPAVGGCVVVSRDAFEKVRGYDERFTGWGEEDRAFVMALETLVHPMSRIEGSLYHLWHPWSEVECFEQPHFEDNRRLCNRYREARGNRDAMKALVAERL